MRYFIAALLLLVMQIGYGQTSWFTGASSWRMAGTHASGTAPFSVLVNPAIAVNTARPSFGIGQEQPSGLKDLHYSYGLFATTVQKNGLVLYGQRSGFQGYRIGQAGVIMAKNLGIVAVGIDTHVNWLKTNAVQTRYQLSANVGLLTRLSGGTLVGITVIDPSAIVSRSPDIERPRSGVNVLYAKEFSSLLMIEVHMLHRVGQSSIFRGVIAYAPVEVFVFRAGVESVGWRGFFATSLKLGNANIGLSFDHQFSLGMRYGMLLQYSLKP